MAQGKGIRPGCGTAAEQTPGELSYPSTVAEAPGRAAKLWANDSIDDLASGPPFRAVNQRMRGEVEPLALGTRTQVRTVIGKNSAKAS